MKKLDLLGSSGSLKHNHTSKNTTTKVLKEKAKKEAVPLKL